MVAFVSFNLRENGGEWAKALNAEAAVAFHGFLLSCRYTGRVERASRLLVTRDEVAGSWRVPRYNLA